LDGGLPEQMTSETTGVKLLARWANEQSHWIRGVVAEVLETRMALGEARVEAFYEMLLREKGLAKGDMVEVPSIEGADGGGESEEPLAITQLRDIENVNRLLEGQTIDFNPAMTVLYGENGVGKTGYVRVLKAVASVRTREDIHPDVGSAEQVGPPKAKILFRLGGDDADPQELDWIGDVGVPPLNRMDVFDSACVDLHVEGKLTYVYTPSDLAVFKHSHETIKAVQEKLAAKVKETKPKGNPYLAKFSANGTLRSKVETLGETTDVEELAQLVVDLPSKPDEERSELEDRVDALSAGRSDARLQVVRSEKALLGRLNAVLDTFTAFDAAGFCEQLESVREAHAALRTATEEGLASFPIPGFQSESWKAFVEAAEAYIAAELPNDYPAEGEPCTYCLQPLGAAAAELLRKYRKFLLGAHQAALTAATKSVNDSVRALEELDLKGISNELKAKVDNAEDAHKTVRDGLGLIPDLEEVLSAVKERREPSEIPTERMGELKAAVTARSGELESTEKDLGEAVTKRKELLAAAEKQLRELSDRMVLAELLTGMRDHVESAKWAARATAVGRTLSGTLKSLTVESKSASERLIYQNFEATFGDECKALKAPAVNLSFAGEGGAPARSKSLAPRVGLRAILSEGEQKVIALADFLAEATLRRSASPIVLDDPVTSLDYRRMKYVAERLVELSRQRQVIVFTHNVWFTMLLLEHFDKNKKGCSYFDITEAGEKRGKVELGRSPKLDTWDDRRKRVNRIIERAKEEKDSEMRTMFVEKGYEALRGACEIIVEQRVLNSVVQSYRPNVMVGNLRDINIDALAETRDGVCDIFDDCCRYLDSHKQPLETLNVRPTLADLESDWKKLQELRKKH